MKSLFLGLAMLISVASFAQTASSTRKGVVQLGKGFGITPAGVMSLSATQTTLPQGALYDLGTMKILLINTTVNASSKVVINLTLENTATGTAIFSTVLHATLTGWATGMSANDVIVLTPEPIPTGNKVLTGRAAKGTSVVLGGSTLTNATAGTQVTIAVTGF